jgi:hypothetical protein
VSKDYLKYLNLIKYSHLRLYCHYRIWRIGVVRYWSNGVMVPLCTKKKIEIETNFQSGTSKINAENKKD